MKNCFKYKNYIGSVEYSDDDNCLFGKVLGIRSLITFEGQSVEELKQSFEFMVDSYLKDCKAANIEPEKPYKGSFNVRIGQDIHRALVILAETKEITLNSFVKDILNQYVNGTLINISECYPKTTHKKV